ncbi:MAG TPA: peptidase S41 [bacterium]|nr:peptidase S41 [bacterium]
MKKRVFFLAACLLAVSCEKILFEKDLASGNPYDNFDYLWNEADRKYSYFELKEIDWDRIRIAYREKLSVPMHEEALFEVLADMLNELRDDHVNLVSPFNISVYNVHLRHPKNYHDRTVEEFYIPDFRITGPFVHDFLEDGEIGYIRYASFAYTADKGSLDYLLLRYRNTKGLILDLRENFGGRIINIHNILERFSRERVLAAYSITRNGPGRNDFGARVPLYVGKHDGLTYEKPVMVLIDRGSYSATTFFSLLTKALPHVVLLGDTTGGGGGLPNGGQLPNGWTYRFSVSQLLDLQGTNYAENGVPPDIHAEFDWTDLTKDEILERAIAELNR